MSFDLFINLSYKKDWNSSHCYTTSLVFDGHQNLLISLTTFIKKTFNCKFNH